MVKTYFRKEIRTNKGGGADWKDNMKIVAGKDTIRRKVDGEWLPEEKGIFIPAGTCLIQIWVKHADFDGNPYPDGEGRAEISVSPWGTYQGKDGKTYGDELSVANLSYDGQNKGRYFDEASEQFQLLTPEIAGSKNMFMNQETGRYEYGDGSIAVGSVDNGSASVPSSSDRVEPVRSQQPLNNEMSSLSQSAPVTPSTTTDFDKLRLQEPNSGTEAHIDWQNKMTDAHKKATVTPSTTTDFDDDIPF